jgi:hypothetical protein
MPGTLDEVEAVVLAVEQAGSVAAAVEVVHPPDTGQAIGVVCALRSIRRRLRAVQAALLALVTLAPERFAGVAPTLTALQQALGTQRVLMAVRGLLARHLDGLPAPLGLNGRANA